MPSPRGAIANELTHIRNHDILIASAAATLTGAVSYIAQAAQFSAIFGGGGSSEDEDQPSPWGGLLFALVVPFAATGIAVEGDPTEAALLVSARKAGVERDQEFFRRVDRGRTGEAEKTSIRSGRGATLFKAASVDTLRFES